MKKKGPRSIPDFSHKRKAPEAPPTTDAKPLPVTQPQTRPVKPQATSAKSGRRGS